MKLQGKCAIVIGAASGTGREIELTYAREGANVATADLNFEAANGAAAVRLSLPSPRKRHACIAIMMAGLLLGCDKQKAPIPKTTAAEVTAIAVVQSDAL